MGGGGNGGLSSEGRCEMTWLHWHSEIKDHCKCFIFQNENNYHLHALGFRNIGLIDCHLEEMKQTFCHFAFCQLSQSNRLTLKKNYIYFSDLQSKTLM